jgi:hypothetical protein
MKGPKVADPIDLAEARADKAGHAGAWEPLDALRSAVRRIEANGAEANKVIILTEGDDGRFTMISAGTTHHSSIALLELAKMSALKEWSGG